MVTVPSDTTSLCPRASSSAEAAGTSAVVPWARAAERSLKASTTPRALSAIALAVFRPDRLERLRTSIPPMTANPRTTIRGEPGMIGTSRILRLRPPMKEKPTSSTSKPSGTMTLIPPQKAKAVMTTSGPSISARRRSMSHPPMTATALVLPLMRQRPLVSCPLRTATCQRRW